MSNEVCTEVCTNACNTNDACNTTETVTTTNSASAINTNNTNDTNNTNNTTAITVTLPEIIAKAGQSTPEEFLSWCDTIGSVIGADVLFEGTCQIGIVIRDGQAQYVETEAQCCLVPIGSGTGFGLEGLQLKHGHVIGFYEPGAYVVGYDIFAARSDGYMWGIYLDLMSGDNSDDYLPLLPLETAQALTQRCLPFADSWH